MQPNPALIPPQWQPPAAPRKQNSLAVVALVSGLLIAPLGIVFGHIAPGQIRRTGEDGRSLAIAGLVLGYVFTGLAAIYIAFTLVVMTWFSMTLNSITATTTETPLPLHQTKYERDDVMYGTAIGECLASAGDENSVDWVLVKVPCTDSRATYKVTGRQTNPDDCAATGATTWKRVLNNPGKEIALCMRSA